MQEDRKVAQNLVSLFVCLFVSLFGVFRHIQIFSLIWSLQHQRPTPIETQNVILYGQLRGPVTLTAGAERFAVEMSLYPSQQLRSVATGIRTPNLAHARRMFQPTAPPPRRINHNKWLGQNFQRVLIYCDFDLFLAI